MKSASGIADEIMAWALGANESHLHQELVKSHRRGSYLLDGLVRMLGQLGFQSSSGMPISGPAQLEQMPELRKATEELFGLFVCAVAIGESVRRRKPSAVGHEIAEYTVGAAQGLESFIFKLASGISAALHAKNDPALAAVLQNEALFRTVVDDEGEGEMTLSELEEKLRES